MWKFPLPDAVSKICGGTAKLVSKIPEDQEAQLGWPSDELLLACGAEYIHTPNATRIVRIAGNYFAEGDIAANAAIRLGAIENAFFMRPACAPTLHH